MASHGSTLENNQASKALDLAGDISESNYRIWFVTLIMVAEGIVRLD